MLSRSSHVHFFSTLWAVAHQAPLSMGFSSQEYWTRLPYSPPGDLPEPRIEPTPLLSPALAGRLFTTSATWEAHNNVHKFQNNYAESKKPDKKRVYDFIFLKILENTSYICILQT